MTNLEREVGALDARMEAVEQELRSIRSDVRQIRDALVGLKGGWMTLSIAVSASTTLGAVLSRYLMPLVGVQ